jgi:cytoskeletal protein RodZ
MHERHNVDVRDRNLRKVSTITGLAFAGGIVATGVFSVVAASAFSGTSHAVAQSVDTVAPDDTMAPAETTPTTQQPTSSAAKTAATTDDGSAEASDDGTIAPVVVAPAPTTSAVPKPATTAARVITAPKTVVTRAPRIVQPPVRSGGS